MALFFLAWEIVDLEERVKHVNRRVQGRILRDSHNPYDLPEREFMRAFRITPDLAMRITNSLRPFLRRQRSTGLAPDVQVLVALNFYAHGNHQRPTGEGFDFSISPSSVSRCLHATTDLLNKYFLRTWVKFPCTPHEREEARNKFMNAPQPFEGAIGAIGCAYVNILAPNVHEEAYVNHHKNHSLNVQAIVDPDLKILNINARYPGAQLDAYIWSASAIRRLMQYHYDRGERQTWLIGDAGYPQEPWLLTPLPNYPVGTRQHQYTEELHKARNAVQHFFGVFKGTWRCLSCERVLMYTPDFAGRIVNACAVLHNMCLHHNIPFNEEEDGDMVLRGEASDDRIAGDCHHDGPHTTALHIQQLMQRRFPHLQHGDEM